MKKNVIVFVIFILCFIVKPVYSLGLENNPDREVKRFLKNYQKAMERNNIEKIKLYYDKNYRNADNFGLNDLAQIIQKTRGAYNNAKYKVKINNITAYDNWAVVQMSDKISTKIKPTERNIPKEKYGLLSGKTSYIVYLKKEFGIWKIIYDDTLAEETSLKYGIAKKIDINLTTPVFIKNGEKYDISLKIDKPDNIVGLASVTREEITYPPKDYKEKFRKIPMEGDIERQVVANNKNLDEYAIASVGFTKVTTNKEKTQAKIEVVGLAYIMKRINMECANNKYGVVARNNK